MPIFALRKIKAVAGKREFFELLIDNESQFEKYFEEVKRNPQYYSEFKTILSYMNLVAELRMIPKEKFRDITPGKEDDISNSRSIKKRFLNSLKK